MKRMQKERTSAFKRFRRDKKKEKTEALPDPWPVSSAPEPTPPMEPVSLPDVEPSASEVDVEVANAGPVHPYAELPYAEEPFRTEPAYVESPRFHDADLRR
jgi:hypothetical protein